MPYSDLRSIRNHPVSNSSHQAHRCLFLLRPHFDLCRLSSKITRKPFPWQDRPYYRTICGCKKPYTLGPRYYSPGGWNQDVVAMQEHHRLLSLQIPGCQFLHNNQVGFPLFLYLDLNTSYKKYRNVLSEKGWKIQSSVIL